MDVSKAFDKRAGAEREKLAPKPYTSDKSIQGNNYNAGKYERIQEYYTAPATELAKKWDGWGTALKPAHEPIIVARKPLEGTVCDNVEKYGTGAINIDTSRIPYADEADLAQQYSNFKGHGTQNHSSVSTFTSVKNHDTNVVNTKGRFPANCITLDDDAFYSKYFNVSPPELSKKASKSDRNSDWRGNPIDLEEKTTDDGRKKPIDNPFLRGETTRVNSHPTVKPTDLMAWLVRLVTPPSGTVLDPFAGSGSTLVASKREGFGFIGIEREPEYVEIIEVRTGEVAN